MGSPECQVLTLFIQVETSSQVPFNWPSVKHFNSTQVFVCKLCLLPFAILRCYFGSFRCSLAFSFNVSGIRFPPCQPRSLQKKHICQSVGLYEQKKMMPIFSSQQSLLANYIGFHYETKRNKEARKEDRRTIQICFVAGEELSCKNGSD